jgi:hypothetical protein
MDTAKESVFLMENRKILSDLYFTGCAEKEALKKRLSCEKKPDENILNNFSEIDSLVKAIARVVFP